MNRVVRIPSDGLELAAETFGEGEPIIFAHGLTGNRHFSRRQFSPLADRYRIVIYDQRGHCDSTPIIDPALYDLPRMAEDLRAVMDYFQVVQAIVGGESMGAATTLAFALKYPARVKVLLLTAPAFCDLPNPAAEGVRAMSREIVELGMGNFVKLSAARLGEVGASPQVIATITEMQSSHDPTSLAVACQTVIDWMTDDWARAAYLTAPTCIIAWQNDNLHPYDWACRLASTIPHAHLETLPSLGTLFTDPAIVGRTYQKFLNEIA